MREKSVKECEECGKYNLRLASECDNCGHILPNQIVRVAENLDFNPNFSKKEEVLIENNNASDEFVVCSECDTINDITAHFCKSCLNNLKKPNETNEDLNYEVREENKVNKIVILEGVEKITLTFSNDLNTFGRNNLEKDISVISRNHFNYQLINNLLYITDISTNGTFINGKRLNKNMPTLLNNNDTLMIANILFTVKYVS